MGAYAVGAAPGLGVARTARIPAAAVYGEMRQNMQDGIAELTWQRLDREGSVTSPACPKDEPSQAVVFTRSCPTADGRLRLVPAQIVPADEKSAAQFPPVLITGYVFEQWQAPPAGRITAGSCIASSYSSRRNRHLCSAGAGHRRKNWVSGARRGRPERQAAACLFMRSSARRTMRSPSTAQRTGCNFVSCAIRLMAATGRPSAPSKGTPSAQ